MADCRWIDAEVHLLPPRLRAPGFRLPPDEAALGRVVYDHPEGPRALGLAGLEELLRHMDAAGIDRAVIMGLPWNDPSLCRETNDYVAECAARLPDRLLGFGVLPAPDRADLPAEVARLQDGYGFRGVKLIPSWQGLRLDGQALAPALADIASRGMVLMPHTDHLFRDPRGADTAFSLLEVARRHPELRIMAPHLGGLLGLYALHEPLRPALGNMLFVASVPTTMRMALFCVQAAGAGRVAFGSDFPFTPSHDQRSVRTGLEGLGLPPADLRRVAGENVLDFLGGW